MSAQTHLSCWCHGEVMKMLRSKCIPSMALFFGNSLKKCSKHNLNDWHCTNTCTHTHAHTCIYANIAHVVFKPRTYLVFPQGEKRLCICILTVALPQKSVVDMTKSRKRRRHDDIKKSIAYMTKLHWASCYHSYNNVTYLSSFWISVLVLHSHPFQMLSMFFPCAM